MTPRYLLTERSTIKVGVYTSFVTFELWAASMVSKDSGACWTKQLLFVINLLTSYQYSHCH